MNICALNNTVNTKTEVQEMQGDMARDTILTKILIYHSSTRRVKQRKK